MALPTYLDGRVSNGYDTTQRHMEGKIRVGGTYRWMQWSRIRARGIERAYELHERRRMIPWRRIENKALITADITHPIVYPWCIGRGKVVVDSSKVYVCHEVC